MDMWRIDYGRARKEAGKVRKEAGKPVSIEQV